MTTPTIEYRTMDKQKAAWPAGPWRDEPDKIQYADEATGLPCLVKRNRLGAWCGYVGLPRSHPYYGRGYDSVPVEVHGGLTYSNRCEHGDEAASICHVPGPGEPDDVWWLGFDCCHGFDLVPGMTELLFTAYLDSDYRDLGYVRSEVAQLARQLAAAATS